MHIMKHRATRLGWFRQSGMEVHSRNLMGQVTIQYSFENAEDLSPGQLQMDSVLDSGERVKGVSY